jgi:UDP-N-acetylglucosamine--N-acetylmuramyl-(pentapeptide) pyrophosphoryl-undecaprenol N-acetylglucosamine transferase
MNEAVSSYLTSRLVEGDSKLQIIHAVGLNNPLPEARSDYLPMAYFHDMAAIYGVADLLITRSGAVTCSELMTVGRFAILVPLSHGNGEQVDNAMALVEQGRALMVNNEEFTGSWLQENLAKVAATAAHALEPATLHLQAADRIASLVLENLLGYRTGQKE